MRKVPTRRALPVVGTLLTVSLLLSVAGTTPAMAQQPATGDPVARELSGVLPDGTAYRMRVPANWNGTLVNDLDAAGRIAGMDAQARFLLEQGYAYSGTSRHPDRIYKFDPRAERDNQARVLDLFMAEFGEPTHTIQYGCSGGGGVALSVAETYPDRVDGAISLNGADGINMSNQRLDLLFALKALLAPGSDLPVVGISYEDRQVAVDAWRAVLESAQATAAGRARIALAGALAQVHTWAGATTSAVDSALYAAGIRYLYDNPAGVMSWNTGIDYERFYANADIVQKKSVQDLYRAAGLHPTRSVRADLKRINAYPRIAATAAGLSYWRQRALTGNPRMPVLQATTAGDHTRWNAMLAAYAQGVRANGKSHLYRQALVGAAGHCTENLSEIGALIETMIRRIDTGAWGNSTHPDALNRVGERFGPDQPRFISTRMLSGKSNRAFFPRNT